MIDRAELRLRVRHTGKRMVFPVTHAIGRLTRTWYFEDHVRVYPDGIAYNRLGLRRRASDDDVRNFRNHRRVYRFAAQFVRGRSVADIGCGAGYGAQTLKEAGAAEVHACDISRSSLRFARRRYGSYASFTRQTIVDLHAYADDSFDVVVSSEVLEHIKEYGLEAKAVDELKRILKPGGLLMLGTPNSELLGEHGFSLDEIEGLFAPRFETLRVFENAFVPVEHRAKRAWEERLARGAVATVVSVDVDFDDAVLPRGRTVELKRGLEPGELTVGPYRVDTRLLHNTHGWIVLAVK
jgi:2-polyprenyl-3-methyl-5-hydroxy-6-metoxy-1,4-benzoquinol methylase